MTLSTLENPSIFRDKAVKISDTRYYPLSKIPLLVAIRLSKFPTLDEGKAIPLSYDIYKRYRQPTDDKRRVLAGFTTYFAAWRSSSQHPGLRFRAALIALFQLTFIFQAEGSNIRYAAETRGVARPSRAAEESGILEGTVTLACGLGAINCKERHYPVGLFIQDEQAGTPPIHVEASPSFSINLSPGIYTVSSADARSWRSLPTLEPITVVIRPGGITHVDVRFEPGPELPRR